MECMVSCFDRLQRKINRRRFIQATAGAGATMLLPGCVADFFSDKGMTAATAILRANYENILEMIEAGFELVPPPDVDNKRVLLKINLVDLPREGKPVVTNPAVVIAAAEAFRRRGAAEIIIADGPALQRDAWQIVDAVGLTTLLNEQSLDFVDLNISEPAPRNNSGGMTGINTLYFSQTVFEADVIVCLPKMKTHHWLGASLSMKRIAGGAPARPKSTLPWLSAVIWADPPLNSNVFTFATRVPPATR